MPQVEAVIRLRNTRPIIDKRMSAPRPSIYRDALQVSPERIAAMTDADLNVLMGHLLRAQAYKCGSPLNEIRVNTEGRAKDDGSDGWSAKPATPDEWFGSSDTCWQFKGGSAGEPARLAGEVTKRIPKETLTNGGRLVVIASGSTNGRKGEEDRLATLTNEAVAAGIPTAEIHVIGSEGLTQWCNQHPAVAAWWAGRPSGLWTLDNWSSCDEHQVPWQASAPVQSEIDARIADLELATGSIYHLHIHGPPGVGKTRFALELCRKAAWRSAVIYIRQAEDLRVLELIDSAVADTGVRLVLVADEVQAEQLRPLRDSIGRGNGRIRLITVGHSPTPDPTRIPALLVQPLDPQVMGQVVNGWYPALPPEHVDFVVRFADGYVRLARLAADAVARSPSMDVRALLSRDEIRAFLDGMLGTGDRQSLYVVAVLTSVGWTDDKQAEGQAVARHFGLGWNTVRATVEEFHRRLGGIVPRGGRYRYMSPTPLGNYLAVEAWTVFPDLLRTLPGVLPSDGSRDAYYERLRSIASNPQARDFAREQLAFFFRLDNFLDASEVRRWSALSSADPDEAAGNILKALGEASLEDRRRIQHGARREAVWTLVRLAWRSSSFRNAVFGLALLAEAENETWANNASAEFVARFQIFLGGTAVPYVDRLSVLDELLATERPSIASLVVKALAQVGNRQASRMESTPAADELPEPEWRPSTNREYFDCVQTAINRLSNIARSNISGIQVDLLDAAQHLSLMLRNSALRGPVSSFFDAIRGTYPQAREPLRKAISATIHRETKYLKTLPAGEIAELESLHTRFQDSSLGARMQQLVGQPTWDREQGPDLKPLAEELLSAPEVLKENWPWLTSGEAPDAWRLGQALAAVDSKGALVDVLPALPSGHDMRLLCGYVGTQRRALGDEWYNAWITSQFKREPRPTDLLFEVAWRCGATESLASMLETILRTEQVSPQIVGRLGFGGWGENISLDRLGAILPAMADTGHHDTAIGILEHRLKVHPTEVEHWKPLALKLATTSDVIRSHNMTSYYWKEVASTLVIDHAREIAAAIFREQVGHGSGTWFAEHSEAAGVLVACVEQDPIGVWQSMQPYLSSPAAAFRFSVGFPRDILDSIPPEELGAWVAAEPENRAPIVARLISTDMSSDVTLASRIIEAYGDNERVGRAFFSEYISGAWWGPASSHWTELAESLDSITARTALPKLRQWASESARSLRRMAERDRQREEEEELRGR